MYLKNTWYAGDSIEVTKTRSGRYGKKIPRQKGKLNPTPAAMEQINERNAAAHLRRIIAENFRNGDYHLILRYRRGEYPDPKTAVKHKDKFLRDLRKLYKRLGLELRYLYVVEHKNSNLHFHFVITKAPLKELKKAWPHGSIHITPLYTEPDFSELAAYLIKETRKTFRDPDSPHRRRWVPSRNLRQPRKVVEVVSASQWRKEPQAVKGYFIDKDSVDNEPCQLTGKPQQFYRLFRISKRE